jgi:hypothetical protein
MSELIQNDQPDAEIDQLNADDTADEIVTVNELDKKPRKRSDAQRRKINREKQAAFRAKKTFADREVGIMESAFRKLTAAEQQILESPAVKFGELGTDFLRFQMHQVCRFVGDPSTGEEPDLEAMQAVFTYPDIVWEMYWDKIREFPFAKSQLTPFNTARSEVPMMPNYMADQFFGPAVEKPFSFREFADCVAWYIVLTPDEILPGVAESVFEFLRTRLRTGALSAKIRAYQQRAATEVELSKDEN